MVLVVVMTAIVFMEFGYESQHNKMPVLRCQQLEKAISRAELHCIVTIRFLHVASRYLDMIQLYRAYFGSDTKQLTQLEKWREVHEKNPVKEFDINYYFLKMNEPYRLADFVTFM